MLHFQHPPGQIVMINVAKGTIASTTAQLPIGHASTDHVDATPQSRIKESSLYAQSSIASIGASRLSRFTGGYEKPAHISLGARYTSGSVCSSMDCSSGSSTGDCASSCDSACSAIEPSISKACFPESNSLAKKLVSPYASPSMLVSNTLKASEAVLSDSEITRIELFFRSQRTQVFVSKGVASLLFTRATLSADRRESKPAADLWTPAGEGVPLVLLNRGGLRARKKRQLQLCVADRRSGFPIFIDQIDNLSDYKQQNTDLHTLYISSDHRKMAGLRFHCTQVAEAFLERMQQITSIPANISLTGPKKNGCLDRSSNASISNHSSVRTGKPKKSEISSPCLFQHLTSLDESDLARLSQLTALTQEANRKMDAIHRSPD